VRWTAEQLREYETRRAVSHSKQPERPKTLARDNERETQSTGCVPVRFTLYRCRLLDVDAKYTSVKDLLDCVVASGIVAGDKEGQITLEVNQVKVKTKEEERTEVEVILS
jgi:hypothetical protein